MTLHDVANDLSEVIRLLSRGGACSATLLELRTEEAEIAALSSDDDSTEGTTDSLPGDDCAS